MLKQARKWFAYSNEIVVALSVRKFKPDHVLDLYSKLWSLKVTYFIKSDTLYDYRLLLRIGSKSTKWYPVKLSAGNVMVDRMTIVLKICIEVELWRL